MSEIHGSIPPGERVGDYQIVGRIGAGGMENGPYTPNGSDFTINFCACAPRNDCQPVSKTLTGGYTIKVGT